MKPKDKQTGILSGKSSWMGFLLVLVAAVTLESTNLIYYFFSQKEIRQKASMQAESQLIATRDKIMVVIDRTENIVWNSLWMVHQYLDTPDSLELVCRHIVQDSPYVVGSTVALVPGYNPSKSLYAPYVFEERDSLALLSLATDEYDYPAQEWFREPFRRGEEYWSEPYFDTGGGDILMTTFSIPVKDTDGKTAAILTADVSLDWLTEQVGSVNVYSDAFDMVVSRTGRIMVCPEQSLVMHETIQDLAARMEDPAPFVELNDRMLSGETGNTVVDYQGAKQFVYYAPVKRTDWSMCIVVPQKSVYSGIRTVAGLVLLLQLLGLALLIFILRSFFKSQLKNKELDEKEKRMDGELRIARDIQMALIPNVTQAFQGRPDLDIAAELVPAKEVGGDLFDSYIRDGKLFFCIGDVSGKGIPASLVMAMARAVFRSLSSHEDSPRKIVTAMNNSMSETNENMMFVTLFCGTLDLESGHLRFCNAGHNPPFLLTDTIRELGVEPNLPLGIVSGMDFKEQECSLSYDDAIFLYTDGLSEAENRMQEQFGEDRIKACLHGRKSAEDHLENIKRKLAAYVGDAPQNDDLTMLFIHYLGAGKSAGRRLTLHNDIQQISLLPGFVDALAQEKHLEPDVTAQLNLALEEAVTNVISYAYPEGTDGTVDIDARTDGGTITFIISDTGKAFDPTSREVVDVSAGLDERPIGGLGIHLIRQIMDVVSYERKDGRNILTITKNI